MRLRIIRGDSWVHLFEGKTFCGRGRRLGLGEREKVAKIGSIIVGPGASLEILNGKGQEIMKLPPLQLVADFSKIALKRRQVSHVLVARCSVTQVKRQQGSPAFTK